jgi:phosphoribosylaminoimidazole-succinocarboxamide synthase
VSGVATMMRAAAASHWFRSVRVPITNSASPPPPLPDEVVERTRQKYVEAYERLTGRDFTTYLRAS